MKGNFDLYEDDVRKTTVSATETSSTLVSDSVFVYLDLTKPLPELIKPIRETLQDKPDGFELNVYMICGLNINNDVELIVGYFKTLQEDFKFRFFIRGIIHPELIEILTFENLFIEQSTRFIYKKETLHTLLKNLTKHPNIFQNFVRVFYDKYHKSDQFYLDLTELKTIGFNFEIF